MLTGSEKLRKAGIVEIISTLFMMIFLLCFFIGVGMEMIQLNGLYSDHNADHSHSFSFMADMAPVVFVVSGYHIYKLVVAILAVRRSDRADSAGMIMGNSIALLVMSVIWLIYIIVVSLIISSAIVLPVLIIAATDVVMLRAIMVSSSQNLPKDPSSVIFNVKSYMDDVPTQQRKDKFFDK